MSLFSVTLDSLGDLYLNELRDLYSAETQLIEALPRMAETASAFELKQAFIDHLQETRAHAERLEYIFNDLGEQPAGEICDAMKGLIKEGESYIQAGGSNEVRDAALIAAAQRLEHYEIAAYGTARSLAQRLGEIEAAELLQLTLEEERETDAVLTDIAEGQVNADADGAPLL